MQEINKFIGERIRELRENRKMTQKELGDVLSYSPMAISHFEKGIRDVRPTDLQTLADHFETDLSFFLPMQQTPQLQKTFFRADVIDEPEAKASLDAFDAFLANRNV